MAADKIGDTYSVPVEQAVALCHRDFLTRRDDALNIEWVGSRYNDRFVLFRVER